ncbi:hypothetical protein [Thiomicrorhabdus lithotrophica]|uniref:DUF5678 domain-containing protein n=1 Tax=Thiomicrorhabdus lithotrophica TaxID=2949997 RepID=A0ABY8CAZ7_9GAMM|nr:hypothetical protein [Thiomicrorhabdus lithotrophica]WEJ62402.1 hypothetical protein NR989_10325 [Thiomicrorhabdus lithotrophica]
MKFSNYLVEFNGYDYVVMFGGRVIAAFASSDDAYHAKRSFEDKPTLNNYDKTPPAMRTAKAYYHGERVL